MLLTLRKLDYGIYVQNHHDNLNFENDSYEKVYLTLISHFHQFWLISISSFFFWFYTAGLDPLWLILTLFNVSCSNLTYFDLIWLILISFDLLLSHLTHFDLILTNCDIILSNLFICMYRVVNWFWFDLAYCSLIHLLSLWHDYLVFILQWYTKV